MYQNAVADLDGTQKEFEIAIADVRKYIRETYCHDIGSPIQALDTPVKRLHFGAPKKSIDDVAKILKTTKEIVREEIILVQKMYIQGVFEMNTQLLVPTRIKSVHVSEERIMTYMECENRDGQNPCGPIKMVREVIRSNNLLIRHMRYFTKLGFWKLS